LFPRQPEVSVCNTNIDWDGILTALINGEVDAYANMQISLMNPNAFGLAVSSVAITYYYHGEEVGTATIENITIVHSAITDFGMNTTFNPSISTAVSMLADYTADTLLFDLGINLNTDVTLLGKEIWNVNGHYEANGIDPTIPDPRKYCLCK